MAKVNEGAHLYDAAKDAIKLDYNFDNAAVQQLFNMFNDTTPKLLSLYEKREFLTYFFLGTHTIPALTPQQAWDFKTSFDIRNFPANGIPNYLTWLNSNGNNYIDAFPYPIMGGNNRIKQNKWQIGYISDIIGDLTYLVNNQQNYNNWLADIQSGAGSWETAINKLAKAENVSNFFAKIAGLFATGKFVKYYDNCVKPDIQKIVKRTTFDPYTGNITVKQDSDEYTILFSKLTRKSDDTANKLMNKAYIKDVTLPYQHRLFCLLCQWLANSFESYALDDIAPEIKKDIKTFWDFTPSSKKGELPHDPHTELPEGLVTSGLMNCIMYSGQKFIEETIKLNDGNTSYKELWDGAKMKLGSGELIDCPFYYVIHVDFDSVEPENNPFTGEALTGINNMIAETIKYRDALAEKIQSMLRNVTDLKTCGTSVTNLSTTIFEEGSTDNKQILNASCTFGSKEESSTESSESVTSKENSFDPNNVQTTFKLDRLAERDKKQSGAKKENKENSSENNNDDTKDSSAQPLTQNKLIIMIVAIVVVILVFGIGIWIYKRGKNNSYKNIESTVNP